MPELPGGPKGNEGLAMCESGHARGILPRRTLKSGTLAAVQPHSDKPFTHPATLAAGASP
jgi:hypothetical protein